MYKPGDDKLEVRELLVKAFASAWEAGDKAVDRDTYINSSINVIDSLQVGPEMIYGEEGQGLLDDELDHLPDMLRADGAWVYYAVPAESRSCWYSTSPQATWTWPTSSGSCGRRGGWPGHGA